MRDAFYHLAQQEHTPATLFLPLGDIAYDYGTEAELQQKFFTPYVTTAAPPTMSPSHQLNPLSSMRVHDRHSFNYVLKPLQLLSHGVMAVNCPFVVKMCLCLVASPGTPGSCSIHPSGLCSETTTF